MVVRVWRAEIDPARAAEYDEFAREISLPMFRSHKGFRGGAFLRHGNGRTVITLWEQANDAAALESSERYRETVVAIMATGFIRAADDAITANVIG